MVEDIGKSDLERAVLVWENGKIPDDIMDKIKEMGIPRYEVVNIAAVPGNQIMQHGAPEWTKENSFGRSKESFLYGDYTIFVGYNPQK